MYSDISSDSEKTLEAVEKAIVKRNKISKIDKERLVNAFENGENVYDFSRLMGINKGTTKNIIGRYKKTAQISTGKIGGYKKSLIDDVIGDSLLTYLDTHYAASLMEMKNFLQETHNLSVCTMTVSNYLKNKYVTKKKLRYTVVGKNSDRVKDLRYEYVINYLKSGFRSHQCIYIDETSVNVWMQRTMGRSVRGQRIYHKVSTQRGPNISLVLAISKAGPIHFKAIIGSFNNNSYQEFIMDVSLRLPATRHYLIHDNASIHNKTLSTTNEHQIINLPPYSPFLNPIETVFNQLKSRLRRRLMETSNIDSLNPAGKRQLIEDLVKEQLQDNSYNSHYHHIKTFYPDCIEKKDIY